MEPWKGNKEIEPDEKRRWMKLANLLVWLKRREGLQIITKESKVQSHEVKCEGISTIFFPAPRYLSEDLRRVSWRYYKNRCNDDTIESDTLKTLRQTIGLFEVGDRVEVRDHEDQIFGTQKKCRWKRAKVCSQDWCIISEQPQEKTNASSVPTLLNLTMGVLWLKLTSTGANRLFKRSTLLLRPNIQEAYTEIKRVQSAVM